MRARGGTISFDPNVRKEILADPEHAARRCAASSPRTDIFMPSGDEVLIFAEAADDGEAAAAAAGARHRARSSSSAGAAGATLFRRGRPHRRPPGLRRRGGRPDRRRRLLRRGLRRLPAVAACRPRDALAYANAAGARTVTVKGPMEGASTFAELDAFMASSRKDDGMSNAVSPPRRAPPRGPPRPASPRSARPIRWSSQPALAHGRRDGSPVLIEATCNQVNQDGGYTGMTPADFAAFVAAASPAEVGVRASRG